MLLMRYAAASSKTRPVTVDAQEIPSTKSAISCAPRVIGSRSVNKNASAQPSRQMRRISVSKSPTTAPSTCARSSIKPHPPTTDAWPLVSSSAYQRVPSPKSLPWAGPYANGRTHSWPTSTQPEPATHRTEAINGHYRTRQTHRQRLPQPHQLPTPNAPHRRRPRRLHPHPTLKSRLSCVSFDKMCGSAALMGSYCAVGLNLSDHLVIGGELGCSVTRNIQSGPSAALKARIYPQHYAQLCINRVDGCLSALHHCLKTDLHK